MFFSGGDGSGFSGGSVGTTPVSSSSVSSSLSSCWYWFISRCSAKIISEYFLLFSKPTRTFSSGVKSFQFLSLDRLEMTEK